MQRMFEAVESETVRWFLSPSFSVFPVAFPSSVSHDHGKTRFAEEAPRRM